jgi:hypothetical protein
LRTVALAPPANGALHPLFSRVFASSASEAMVFHPKTRDLKCMLLDLDDTLYRVEGIATVVRTNIQRMQLMANISDVCVLEDSMLPAGYMVDKLDIPPEGVEETTAELYYQVLAQIILCLSNAPLTPCCPPAVRHDDGWLGGESPSAAACLK